jgi:peptidoglycan/LPS O-acetylase OafA/YrhL
MRQGNGDEKGHHMNVNKNNNIGMLHMIGAIFVMVGHWYNLLGITPPVIFGNPMHAIGVKMIFLISGYLITKSICRINGKRSKVTAIYFVKRLFRIYPEYIVCILFSVFIVGTICTGLPINEYLKNPTTWAYITNNMRMHIQFALPEVFANNYYSSYVNGSLWTMPIEIVLYIIVWLAVICFKNEKSKRNFYTLITIITISAHFIRIIFYPSASAVFYWTDWIQALSLAPYFMIGGLFYFYNLKKYINVQVTAVLVFAFSGFIFNSQAVCELVCMIVLSAFVMAIALNEKQDLKIKFLNCECAYGVYLYGFVVQQFLIDIIYNMGWKIQIYCYMIISILCTYCIALLSNWLIYRPINKLLNKMLNKIL